MQKYEVAGDPLRFLWGSTVWMMTCQMAMFKAWMVQRQLIAVNRFWVMVLVCWYGKPYTALKKIGPLYI